MHVKPIKSEADYDAALVMIDGLMGAAPDTPAGDELEVLVTLVEAYETARWPIAAPEPISAIKHVMEARSLRQRDLAMLIGSQPHASEVLNHRRALTLPMIRALSAEWGIPTDVLIGECDVVSAIHGRTRASNPGNLPAYQGPIATEH